MNDHPKIIIGKIDIILFFVIFISSIITGCYKGYDSYSITEVTLKILIIFSFITAILNNIFWKDYNYA